MEAQGFAGTAICIILGLALVIYFKFEAIYELLITRQVKSRRDLGRFEVLRNDGRLHTVFCGTGSPVADRERAQSAIAILVEGDVFMIDCGECGAYKAELLKVPIFHTSKIFITHHHSDHITGIPDLVQRSGLGGRDFPIHIYGPAGTEDVVNGTLMMLKPDHSYRLVNADLKTIREGHAQGHTVEVSKERYARTLVFEDPKRDLKVFAFLVLHSPVEPAFGYRIEHKGKAIVFSGDTRHCPDIAYHCREPFQADVLVHEGYNKDMCDRIIKITRRLGLDYVANVVERVGHYHTAPGDVASVAREGKVKKLVFTHIMPPIHGRFMRWMFLRDVRSVYDGEVVIADDGTLITL